MGIMLCGVAYKFMYINPLHLLSKYNTIMSSLPIVTIFMILAFGNVLGTENQKKEKPHRAFFVFGDSLVDNGNNNHLTTTARADSPPYGIDYPSRRPTGRFSNGLNLPDVIGGPFFLPLLYFSYFDSNYCDSFVCHAQNVNHIFVCNILTFCYMFLCVNYICF